MGQYKKAFQLKADRPLSDRCIGYIVNKFEQVWRGGGSLMWLKID